MALPPELNSVKVGQLAQESGYLLSYNSEYLRQKNWIQICLMGECAKEKLVSLLNCLNRVCFKRRPARVLASDAMNTAASEPRVGPLGGPQPGLNAGTPPPSAEP
jgi:hypothetical protein